MKAYEAARTAYDAWKEYHEYLAQLTAYEENVTAWGNHEKYLAEKAAYDAWKDYFGLLDNYVRTLMAVSAKNTVVKTATYASVDFTPAVIVGGDGIESGDSMATSSCPRAQATAACSSMPRQTTSPAEARLPTAPIRTISCRFTATKTASPTRT